MKTCNPIIPLLLVSLLPACKQEEVPQTPDLVEHTLYATLPGEEPTRTVLDGDNDRKILWSANESISIFSGGGNYEFQGNNDAPASSASFTGTAPADLGDYIALYPYSYLASYDGTYVSTTLPVNQFGKAGSFADRYLITADDATGTSILFNHVCSGLRFQVNANNIKSVSIRGNNGEKIAGAFRFRFTAADTPTVQDATENFVTLTPPYGDDYFQTGKYYYIIILPTTFSKGFTLTADNGTQVGELRFNTSITFSPGTFKNITGNLNERMAWDAPLSQVYYGQQNSFCLSPGQTIRFNVMPRQIYGAWQRSGLRASSGALVPTDGNAPILWGSSVASASVSGEILTITASSTPGSSLVAIKDQGGFTLWSYLIWVTSANPGAADLGGELYFQWGRKDPLRYSDGTGVAETQGLAYSISHPTEFMNGGANTKDWYSSTRENQDETLWGAGGQKTVWDPCPEGWRVPEESYYSSFSDAIPGYNGCGWLSYAGSLTHYPGTMYWTATPSPDPGGADRSTWFNNFTGEDPEDPFDVDYRQIAAPIRCVAE